MLWRCNVIHHIAGGKRMSSQESVNQLLADLHAHRVATLKPEELAYNINQRQYLVDHADRSGFVKPGDVIENFELPDVDGGTVVLDELLAKGPVVLLFFRFAGCPACNLALPYYQRQLAPAVAGLGATLVAISPQIPLKLRDIKERHGLSFLVASDTDNKLGTKFGIVFTASAETQKHLLSKGTHLGETTGTGTWDLPMPAAIVIDRDRGVRFAAISPDWLVRTEADEIIGALREITKVSEAA
jgi:peroxiredoxin